MTLSHNPTLHRTLALAFGTIASLNELAPIVALLRAGAPLAQVLAAGLAYQTGGAAARWLPGTAPTWILVGLMGTCGLIWTPQGGAVWFMALALLAWALQAARRSQSAAFPTLTPRTAQKRISRVIGFLLAAVLPLGLAIAPIVFGIACAALANLRPVREQPAFPRHPIEVVMIMHQMHYFSYCYGLLFLLSAVAGGPTLTGLWFAVGWVTYLSAEQLWRGARLATALVVGHLIVAATLAGLALLGEVGWAAVACWTLTGFGGGTVYALSRLHRQARLKPAALDVSEDIGHLGGRALALALSVLFGMDPRGLAGVGAFLALATIVGVLTVTRQPTLTQDIQDAHP